MGPGGTGPPDATCAPQMALCPGAPEIFFGAPSRGRTPQEGLVPPKKKFLAMGLMLVLVHCIADRLNVMVNELNSDFAKFSGPFLQ